MIHDIIKLSSRRATSIATLCNKLVVSEKDLRSRIKGAREEGFHVRIVDGYVVSKASVGPVPDAPAIELGETSPGRYRVGQFTDLHFGSRHADKRAMSAFLKRAWLRGVRTMVCTGDVLDGNAEVLIPDQKTTSFDGQCDEAVALVEDAPKFSWVAIDGNHDGHFSSSIGIDSGRLVQDRMRAAGVDWTYAGRCLGHATISRARWQLWHPHGGASTRNALRRILNARAESQANEGQPRTNVLAMGHFHKFVGLPIFPEGVFGVAGGTFQRKRSEFANRIGNGWDVGGVIVSYQVARGGHVSEVAAEFLPAVL